MRGLLGPATKTVIEEARTEGKSKFSVFHGYIYGRWQWQYTWFLRNIRIPLASKRAKERWSDHYHGKVLPLALAESILMNEREIPMRDLGAIIPYARARQFKLDAFPEIVVFECGCRRLQRKDCHPSQVCIIVGKPFTDFILEKHPRASRKVDREEALALLREEDGRGHLHVAWFKDACLDRFYAICNCCKCCCVTLELVKDLGVNMLAPSGYIAELESGACKACNQCSAVCPFDAIVIENGQIHLDEERCMGCGLCVGRCEQHAWSLKLDERRGAPLDIRPHSCDSEI